MVSLFWKCFERETANGHIVYEYDYIYSKEYSPKYTYGVILKDEIDSVVDRLRKCPEYNLHPQIFDNRELKIKLLLLLSFTIFCFAWVSLTLFRGYFRLFSFLLLNIIFLMLFVISCARLSNNRGQYKHYLARRDVYFDEVMKNTNRIFRKRGVKFFYNDMSKSRDIIVRIRRPLKPVLIQENTKNERHYLGFETILKNAEEQVKNGKTGEIPECHKVIAKKNVYGSFVPENMRKKRVLMG